MNKRIYLGVALLLAASNTAFAQGYPNKPIRLVVPYAAGGNADITGRVLGQKLSEFLGVPVVVDNRGGANGSIGTEAVVKSAPDGYTLLFTASGPIVVNPVLYKTVRYDPVKDLQPIGQAANYQFVLVVPSSSPWKNVKDLVAAAKTQPLSYGSSGIGGGGHLSGELLSLMEKVSMTHVPYRGSAPALVDLLGGQLPFTFDTVITSIPYIQSGRLKPFAVSGPTRASALPDVPTMQELGYKGFDITQFQGFFAPAGTDPAIVKRLNETLAKVLKSPDVITRLVTEGGNEIVGGSPEDFTKLIKSELALYGKLIREANIKAE